ncbi:hypothetical protein L211DRAFT_850536 [Terfezia boudieri ATCC MYA-4762]|uniref:Uncharacterized protein n=1 Tax=Terfezia boudieri ATCC MYA-4762 TaxID=1051890 RepID=A0A3N4LHX1_9PEZI|nr:hypothetical protein L211DRAFT_850536 [Terfezia boudieri ATCC MYA-4762]
MEGTPVQKISRAGISREEATAFKKSSRNPRTPFIDHFVENVDSANEENEPRETGAEHRPPEHCEDDEQQVDETQEESSPEQQPLYPPYQRYQPRGNTTPGNQRNEPRLKM